MSEHKYNPVAVANRQPQQRVQTFDLGDNISLIDVSPTWGFRGDKIVVALVAMGGRRSELVPMQPVRIVLEELGMFDVADIKAKFLEAIDGPADSSIPNPESSSETSTSDGT